MFGHLTFYLIFESGLSIQSTRDRSFVITNNDNNVQRGTTYGKNQ